ncbi:MAG: transglycosylase SLT domain-containing protein [Pseudomonadota bacterium]
MLSKFILKALISGLSSCLLLAPVWAQTNHTSSPARADDVLLEMNKAFKRGDKARLAQLLPQTQGHALEPWAAYWELRARLDEASAREVQDFLARYAGSYQEDRLRNDWLLLLGQRRDWGAFAAEYPNYRMGDDKDVRCYALLVDGLTNPAAAARDADQVRKNWYAQREASDGCTSAASRLVGNKSLTTHDVWIKARLAMEANRPRAARDAVEIIAPEALGLVTELNSSPAKFLATKVIAIRQVRKEIIVLALVKLATSDADGAARFVEDKWGLQLTAEERNWVWGAIGKQAASRLSSDALGYFAKVSKDTDLSDDMLGWKVRAALRAGSTPRWPLVLGAINAMSDDARKDPTWVYWKARALLSNAPAAVASAPMPPQRAEALALLQSIASVRGFYEQLALEELGQKITVPPRPAPLTPEEKEAARLNPGLNRAAYAIALGLRSEGVREWNYSTNLHQRGGMGERELLAAAQFACDRAIWDRCINTSEKTPTVMDFEQRFPTPFREAVLQRSRDINLDPAYVYGLIRQESRFIMDARSGVGASGLMQVMPATARETARYIGLTGFTAGQINDRDTNIVIGTAYLKRALDDFGGSMALAAAAYNAGPGRPRNWRNGPVLEAAIWAENVPFGETRDYVKKVLSNTTNYAALLTGQPQSLKARLGSVGPRDASAPPPDEKMP